MFCNNVNVKRENRCFMGTCNGNCMRKCGSDIFCIFASIVMHIDRNGQKVLLEPLKPSQILFVSWQALFYSSSGQRFSSWLKLMSLFVRQTHKVNKPDTCPLVFWLCFDSDEDMCRVGHFKLKDQLSTILGIDLLFFPQSSRS